MDVLCVGHAAWDISVFLTAYPAENSKSEIQTMLEGGGGPAANAACLLSRWGTRCALAAAVGADDYGARIARELAADSTDVALLYRDPARPTPVSVILVNAQNGSRTIINRKAPAAGAPLRLAASLWPEPPRVLLFDGHELAAARDAMQLFPQACTILDAGSVREGTRELARRVDHLVCSEKFARDMSGVPDLTTPAHQAAALGALHQLNGKPVVITLGKNGALHGTGARVEQLPALAVQARDTTGAGDIFHGAFAYGVLTGLPWLETLRLALAAASLSVAVPGGRTSIPTLAQAQAAVRHIGT
jgi:sugar/nucleoside kinase (ribokinase family)